ncbi:glucan biosynthesis protein [Methylobacterium planeticum]|uniref:Glucan biosynthesis protein n=1 Tax=Methylobacterium planeticum TaxID=2615211 RepID=A0A6N6MV33_9HYPH|nr:glucan biosynthesis protein [Methylobacterium planeticum]KAB1075818.1 glucan biosynthesis protein [Methylobacterium planeticum]
MAFEGVAALAEARARAPYAAPPEDLPPDLARLSYDGYRAIAFRPAESLRLGPLFSAQLFHRGFLQRKRVDLYLQPREGPPRPIVYASSQFDLGPGLAGASFPADLGFAGFRLHSSLASLTPRVQEEFLVFLGASYFRLRGKGQEYGLSARGAAIGTGAPEGEEFPDFVAHWICEPEPGTERLSVLSLLDSPSLAGAFRFVVEPGDPSRLGVTAALFPRKPLARLGLAPLTSMFLHGQNGPGARGAEGFDDFRPEVHDSDGLVVEGAGDRLWRPLVNGRRQPQISAFAVAPLRGFGLLQRERSFAAYLDVQARHEARPGLWVRPEPGGDGPAAGGFAAGAVQLFEIPSREEYMDNVVAAFVPAAPVGPGPALRLAYGLTTVGAEPVPVLPGALARVVSTRVGSAERLRPTQPPSPERRLYAVDFEGPGLPADPGAAVAAAVSASAGQMVEPVVERVPQTGSWRLYVEWRPPAPMPPGDVVLRAHLVLAGRILSETWDAVA